MISQGLGSGFLPTSFWVKKDCSLRGKNLIIVKKFEVNCLKDKDMDVRTSALVDGVAECLNGMCLFCFCCYLNL
jgi:cystathionine beta-lyase